MKLFRLLGVGAVLFLACLPAMAQSGRLDSLADRLVSQADELADRHYRDFSGSYRNSRADVETLYLSQQLSASANLFRRMVRDRRSESELRDALAVMADLSRRADRNNQQRSRLNDIQRTLDDISREIGNRGGGGGGGGRGDDGDYGGTSGTMRWRGRVDDEVYISIRDQTAEVRTIGGNEYFDATYNFSSPMPRRRGINVQVTKIKGRGDLRIIQQPSRDNNFTTVVQVLDKKGGADTYEFELRWQ